MLSDWFGGREDPVQSLLVQIPFFRDLTRRELQVIRQVLRSQTCRPGEEIFKQGEPGAGMYVVVSGGVEVIQEDEDGTRLRLGQVGPGTFFGELALLDDAPRTASAAATEETEMLVLYRSELLGLAEERPGLGVKIVMHLSQTVAERLRRTNRALKEARDELEAVQDGAETKLSDA